MSSLLRNARLVGGEVVDVRVGDDGVISEVGAGLIEDPESTLEDLDGRLLLSAPAEPHAHLDKALTADAVPNPAGDLMGAINAWRAGGFEFTVDDIYNRARAAVLHGLANGITAVRSHINILDPSGIVPAEALVRVREDLGHLVDIQIVGLVSQPDTNAANYRLLEQSLDLGVDVVGGCPHIEDDRLEVLRLTLDLAGERGLPIDLHTDENLNPESRDLLDFARAVESTGFEYGAVASHCVSLGMMDPDEQRSIAHEVAHAGIGVIALPQTNLFLQGRDHPTATPRGLTALRVLDQAGVVVAGGADNVQDPFNSMGRVDPFETASLLVMAGHLLPCEAWAWVSERARSVMGLDPIEIGLGHRADLLAVRADSLREAIASAPADRVVVKGGKVVSRTLVTREFPGLD
ncbi:MAG: amidohydrolase family protein [Actinomycetia bacterium]|nr:amidohydrolase family protein [Actinomycetes bacterium]